MSHDNPANRLWVILKAGKQLEGKTNCREAWWKLLGGRGDRTLLMSRIGKLMELPAMIIDSLKDNYPNRGNTWAHWESHLDTAFASQNLNANWDSFIAHIDDTSLTLLEMSSDLIEAKFPQENLSEEDLAGLRLKLTEVTEEILASDINNDLKKYLARALRRLVTAIDDYQVTGGAGIVDAVEAAIGHAVVSSEYRGFLSDSALGAKFVAMLGVMANAVTVAPALNELAFKIAGLLTK